MDDESTKDAQQVSQVIQNMVLNLRDCGIEKLSDAERGKLADCFIALAQERYEAGLKIGHQKGKLEQTEYIVGLIEASQNPKSDA